MSDVTSGDSVEHVSSVLRNFTSLDFHSRQTLYDQVEQLIAGNLELLSPLDVVMHFLNDTISGNSIPDTSTMSMQRVASLSDHGGLWLVDSAREVVSVAVVAQISPYADDLKCGEYLDMNVYNQEINLDSLRRASARLFFNEVSSSAEFSDEIANIYTAHSSRFQKLLNVLQEVTMQYLDSVKAIDDKLYPQQSVSMSTFVELHDFGHYGKLKSSEKERNLKALLTDKDVNEVEIGERLLGHWPDSEGVIRSLAERHDLSSVRMHVPEVYDSQGALVHPMDYDRVLTSGGIVLVEFNFHLWDITKGSNGKAVNKPNRICSNIIRKLRVLPEDEDDMRVFLHTEALRCADDIDRLAEASRLAEEARELSRREEVLRLEKTMAKAKLLTDAKKKRLEELRVKTTKNSPSTVPAKRAAVTVSNGSLRKSKRLELKKGVVDVDVEEEETTEDIIDMDKSKSQLNAAEVSESGNSSGVRCTETEKGDVKMSEMIIIDLSFVHKLIPLHHLVLDKMDDNSAEVKLKMTNIEKALLKIDDVASNQKGIAVEEALIVTGLVEICTKKLVQFYMRVVAEGVAVIFTTFKDLQRGMLSEAVANIQLWIAGRTADTSTALLDASAQAVQFLKNMQEVLLGSSGILSLVGDE
ncbi:hypothetical protein F5879DRAFT_921855 [Lentinula edodes]|nr:hypothetical protein F5879DRAFT_921855 [Lentinula edodes]